MPWDSARAYLRFTATYLAKDERKKGALMGDGAAAWEAGVAVLMAGDYPAALR